MTPSAARSRGKAFDDGFGPTSGLRKEPRRSLTRPKRPFDFDAKPRHVNVCFQSHWRAVLDDLKGHWSIWVNGNWRLTFTFEGTDAILVDYQDYH
jgi:proteic killer suppression protein